MTSMPLTIPLRSILRIESIEMWPKHACQVSSEALAVIEHATLADSGVLSQLATGCVTCHTSHGCVTHFRPILGNLVEVTLMTSPFMYYVSHAKGTSFP